MTANLDASSFDRLTWMRHLSIRLLKGEAGTSVLIRRALQHYAEHLEALLASHTPDTLERERALLSRAARGIQVALPEDELLAVPPKPFTAIQEAAGIAAKEADAQRLREQMIKDLEKWNRQVNGGGRGG